MRRIVSIAIILTILASSAALFWETAKSSVAQESDPYVVNTLVDDNGQQIDEVIVPGKPPEILTESAVDVPDSNIQLGINTLSNVPAFGWTYGCSATSAAMLFGYYDRTGYSNMYTGPTNGSVCPLDNSVWGTTSYPSVTCSEVPLSATHQGIDGRTTKGSVDDYWIDYGNTGPDPYIAKGWTEHTQGDCTGDFMGTNESRYGLPDGATAFYYYASGDPLYDFTGCEPGMRDGTHGMKLFAVSRGYSVTTDFFQLIQGAGTDPTKGFTFANYVAEIDAGRPVLIQVQGHTMIGFGYNTTGNIVYLHDTWDFLTHTMTWGGSYCGLQHYAVTVLRLASVSNPVVSTVATNDATSVGTVSATLNMSYDFKDYSSGQVQFAYEPHGGNWTYTSWVAKSGADSYSEVINNLSFGTIYHFKARLKYNTTEIEGSVKDFTTAPVAIDHYSVSIIGSPQIAGTSFSVIIQAQDQGNNNINIGTEIVNISFGEQDALATPVSISTTNGAATVSMIMTKAQSGQSIIFTGATSNKTGASNSFDVNAGVIHHYSVSNIGSPQIAGTAFDVTVQAQDQYNNNINTYNETVSTSFGKTDAGVAPISTSTTDGTATVSMIMNKSQSGQSIIFTGATSNKTGTSNSFNVNAGVINHYSVSSISSPQTVGTAFNVIIQAQDQYNNNINTGYETVKLSFSQTDAGAAPTSTSTTNGTATVSLIMAQAQSGQAVIFTGVPSNVSSTSNTFTVNDRTIPLVPTLKSPVSNSTVSSLTPELQWNASTGATSYGVQVSTSPSFATTVINLSGINNTFYDILSGKLGYSTTYYWRVNASNANGTSSSSSYWLFITPSKPQPPAAPILVSPTSSSKVSSLTPTLQWNASTGATSYGVQISTNSRFSTMVINLSGINNTFYNVLSGKLGYSSTYYWRVSASNANGTSSWSSYWLFVTPSKPQPPTAPVLISPTNGSTVSSLTPALQWNASTGATSYGVQVSTSYRFTSLVVNQTGITALSFSVPTGALKASTTYYWRVNASNANGTSSWSNYQQFKTSSTAVSRGRQMFGQENQGLPDLDAIHESSTTAPPLTEPEAWQEWWESAMPELPQAP